MYALTLLLAAASGAPKTIKSAVTNAAAPFMKNGQTVCMSVGVLYESRSFTYDFGTTTRGSNHRPTSRTSYVIASITKTFTGLLLAQAATEGKVSLDDDIRKYLPGPFPNLEYEGQPIRLWQLINHTSGLPRDFHDTNAAGNIDFAKTAPSQQAAFDAYTEAEFLRDIRDAKLTRVPGVSFSYSNVAAQLLGVILEHIYAKPFDALVKEKIVAPLGMRDTKSGLSPAEVNRLPRAYSASGPFVPAMPLRFPAAGSLKSTTADMLKYMAYHLAETDPAVKLTHQNAGTTVWDSNGNFYVGLNWQILKTPQGRVIFQDGNLPGFHSMCVMIPERKVGVIVLTAEEVREKPAALSPLIQQILHGIDPTMPAIP